MPTFQGFMIENGNSLGEPAEDLRDKSSILTHYDLRDFFNILQERLGTYFNPKIDCVIQSYRTSYVGRASGLSILFFKDLSGTTAARKKQLFEKYSRSKFARENGWDTLMRKYHELMDLRSKN